MGTSVFRRLWSSCLLVLGSALVVSFFSPKPASANQGILFEWELKYGDVPGWEGVDECFLCHLDTPQPWNGYGWNLRSALASDGCCAGDLDAAFESIEGVNSDLDVGACVNFAEIVQSTQPGWTTPTSKVYFQSGATEDVEPPASSGPYDPDEVCGTGGVGGLGGTGGVGGVGGAGGMGGTGGDDMFPPGQYKRRTIVVVSPGESIQEAIDRARPGTRIYVLAGDYTEPNNPTNGLKITKSGIHLVGQSNSQKRVRLLAAPGQRNGIVVVPPEVAAAAQPQGRVVESRTDCMGCHTDMGPPFPLHPDVPSYIPSDTDPYIYDIRIEGITVEGFPNNGIFTEHVDGFVFDDLESIDNRNYGIFPVLSKNGVITNSYSEGSDLDSGLWVETSENVLVQGNVITGSVNGIEVSNSDDILVIDNEAYGNTIGAAILLLPDIYDNKDSAKRIDLVNNWFHDNNKTNTARPGSVLSFIPKGQGILYVGADDGEISGNLVEHNDFVGIAVVDYCLPFEGTPFACSVDPTITLEYLFDQAAEDNRVADNVLVNNGTNPDPGNPFPAFAAELTLLTLPAGLVGLPGDDRPYHGNCYENNQPEDAWFFSLFDATIGVPPPWTPPPCP